MWCEERNREMVIWCEEWDREKINVDGVHKNCLQMTIGSVVPYLAMIIFVKMIL